MRGEPREMPVKQESGIKKSGKVFGQGQKTAKIIRAGLYARVSTQDQQTLPMQNRAMREYAARRSWTVAMQVKEGWNTGQIFLTIAPGQSYKQETYLSQTLKVAGTVRDASGAPVAGAKV